jgi:N-acetyl-gamma-glutamylphosphate reductase
MGARIAVAGASGYVGGELLRLLAGHPGVEIVAATAHAQAGSRLGEVHPNLVSLADLPLGATEPAAFAGADLVFLALPHGESAALSAALPRSVKIVDLGADHRLRDPGAWSRYYGGAHQHVPEIKQATGARSLSMTPVLAPMPRGILATVTARPARPGLGAAEVREALAAAYAGEPFVRVLPEGSWPHTAATSGSNAAHLQATVDSDSGRLVVTSAIDNLGKGAAGQAVQCANLMLGLPEATGLTVNGVAP